MKKSELQQIIKEELSKVLNENESLAKSKWNRLDFDSKEDLLLRFVKNPDNAVKLASLAWDRLPDSIAGNRDFQDTILDTSHSGFTGGVREGNISLDDQGYAASYYNIKSDIAEKWDDTNIIKGDIKGYLALAHESGGAVLVRKLMNTMLDAVNESKPLLRKMKGTQDADVDLA